MGVVVNSAHEVSATPFSSEEGLLTLFLSGPSHKRQPSNETLQCVSFPGVAVPDIQLQHLSPVRSQVLPENLL